MGEDNGTYGGSGMEGHFGKTDSAVFGIMLVASVGIGVCSSLRGGASSTQEYLVGGRNMSPFPVALSLVGGFISAISILGNATEVYYFGIQLSTSLLGAIVGTIFLHSIIIPIIYNLRITSLNEYLELRYNSRFLRQVATFGGMLTNAIYMGMCLYAPSLALSTVTNLSVLASMCIMGGICTFYITIGGVKAVVYTDVLQTLLMFGGVLVVVILCCRDLGGVANVIDIANQGQRLEFFNMDPSPYVRHTFWSTFTFGFFLVVSAIGLNQSTLQRFISVRSLTTALRLCWTFLVGLWVLWVLFFFSGLVAYATYSTCDPLAAGYINKADQILPYLVVQKLSHLPGLSGLFVAAVYGGVLSSVSSTGNAMACLVWEDFLKLRPYFTRLSDPAATKVIKLLSSVTGVLAVILGLMVGNLGNIFHVINLIVSCISGPIVGTFLSGMLLPWTNYKGSLVGIFASFVIFAWLVVGKFIKGGGAPTMLPLSTHGCLNNSSTTLSPTITFNSSTYFNLTTSEMPDLTSASSEEMGDDGEVTIYNLSYCFIGILGAVTTMLINSAVSVLTGPTQPKQLSEDVVFPPALRLYTWAWQLSTRRHLQENKEQGKQGDGEEGVSMLHISSLHTPSS
ncbi:hypothetical protein Pcinc_029361 [Petrolisthes cinctipes]|uniref:Sodium-coupled monocarboxylate transporter 1 n=1 Tax=Petrolisthes cinctipes TaxID=88211 RepID=A0AAE1F1N1_PETCI|nr:hypothetical protein Pcinc_029361 [Petrolisthes cinctipes]